MAWYPMSTKGTTAPVKGRWRAMALCSAVLLPSTMMAASAAHAAKAPGPDPTLCTNSDWQAAECGYDDAGPLTPSRQYTVIGTARNTERAYAEAVAEADNLCSGYEILNVRFAQLPVQWRATITIDCPTPPQPEDPVPDRAK